MPKKQEATERLIACDLLVKDEYSLDQILAEADKESSTRLYDELTKIENIRFSQLATLSYDPGENFEDQSGLTRLLLAKFLTIKAYLCHTKGLILNKNNYEDHFLDHTEIRLEDIQRRMHQLFNEARAVGEHNPVAFEQFGAAFLCADLALTPEAGEDHAAYIQSWLKVLKDDKRAIFAAAAHAQRAADFLHGLQAVKETSEEVAA